MDGDYPWSDQQRSGRGSEDSNANPYANALHPYGPKEEPYGVIGGSMQNFFEVVEELAKVVTILLIGGVLGLVLLALFP